MEKKVVLILGANSDIAGAVAKKFASEGYCIQLAGRDLEKLNSKASDIRIRYNSEVEVVLFDAQQYASHGNFYQVLSKKPDVVVLAFGFLGENDKALQDWNQCENILSANSAKRHFELNLELGDPEWEKERQLRDLCEQHILCR